MQKCTNSKMVEVTAKTECNRVSAAVLLFNNWYDKITRSLLISLGK